MNLHTIIWKSISPRNGKRYILGGHLENKAKHSTEDNTDRFIIYTVTLTIKSKHLYTFILHYEECLLFCININVELLLV